MSWFEFAAELEPELRNGNLSYCIERTIAKLKSIGDSPYLVACEVDFTNSTRKVAKYVDKFIKAQRGKFEIKAIYAGTGEFDINPDRWYLNLSAYDKYVGHEDYNWLCSPQSEMYPDMTLVGMEDLQDVYYWEAGNDEFYESRDYASLLVVLRFQDLIKRSACKMRKLKVPLFASAHEYTFIYEFRP